MSPRKWRKEVLKITLGKLSALMEDISPSYISRVERGEAKPSGRLLKFYHELSGGQVTPSDFK
ncbi:MAG: helix-turn-helix transcriptional regulator [Planctomycetes bacterium]|nr:helix-turn-helix transcriptional regulator [Planctomycetota bacterium]